MSDEFLQNKLNIKIWNELRENRERLEKLEADDEKQVLFPLHKGRNDKPVMEIISELEQKSKDIDEVFAYDIEDLKEKVDKLEAVLLGLKELITDIIPKLYDMKPSNKSHSQQMIDLHAWNDRVFKKLDGATEGEPSKKGIIPNGMSALGYIKSLANEEQEEPQKYNICFTCEWIQGNWCTYKKESVNTQWSCGNWNPKPIQKDEQEAPRKGEAEPDLISNVVVECPKCGYTVKHYFKHGKQLIAEFLSDLDNVEHWSIEGLEITPMNEIDKIKEKWEGRAKSQRDK